jgi:uncharacterized protein (TIGR04222 family)
VNPFDLPGPQFLGFYIVLGLLLAGLLWIFRHHGEKTTTASAPELTDPYLVAYLRAGPAEVWRLATIRLIDRGLLRADDATISVVAGANADNLQNEVERATLEWFRRPQEAFSLIKESSSPRMDRLVAPYEESLIKLGLLPNKYVREGKQMRFALAAGLLALIAIAKILIALDRGHRNLGFLVVLAVMSLFALYKVAMPKYTLRGRAVLDDLEKLFSRLHQPGAIKAGQSSAEVMWMAAVFGIGALAFSHVEKMYPKAHAQSGSGCGSSCGSSCGGGGCGGGCGGCGG